MTAPNPQNSAADDLNNFGLWAYETVAGSETFHTIDGTSQDSEVVGTTGNDVIVGVAGNQELVAGGGDNALLGGAGGMMLYAGTDPNHPFDPAIQAAGAPTPNDFNVLVGGPNDVLIGGTGQDIFVFGSHCGQNTVRSFDPTTDTIVIPSNIDGSGITSAANLESHMTENAQGTVIDFGGGDRVTLAGVHPALLQSADFVVV